MLKKVQIRSNEAIWAREVRVIDELGKQLGVFPRDKALIMAKEKGLDLIEVNPNTDPVVCRIIDYDKYRYILSKKEKEKRQGTKRVELKEIRIGVRTGEHDLEFKKSNVLKFLKKGKKVKIEVTLKGRERSRRELGREALESFLLKIQVEAPVKIDQPIMSSPRGFNCIVSK